MNRRATAAVAAAATIAVAISATFAIANNDERPSTAAVDPAAVQTVPAAVAEQFGVFRRPRTKDDVVTGGAAGTLRDLASRAGIGFNEGLSRHVAATGMTIVPGTSTVCFSFTWGGSCRDLDRAAGPPYVSRNGDQTTVAGLVPDGVKTVTIGTPGGAVKATVAENTYTAELSVLPTSVSYDGPSGPFSYDFGDTFSRAHSPTLEEARAAQDSDGPR